MQPSKRIRRIAAVTIVIILMLAVCCTPGLASFKVKINSSSAKVYKSPSTSSAHVSGRAGTTLTCTSYSNGWARVSYKGNTGYMKIENLNLKDRVTMYTKSSTPVYKKASGSSKLGTLPAGSKVYAVGYANGYIRIQNKSGSATGYVKSSKVSRNSSYKKASSEPKKTDSEPKKTDSEPKKTDSGTKETSSGSSGSSSGSSKITTVINAAKAQLGKPYGYSTPSSFNCSSLVKYSYAKIGYSMKSSAAKIASDSRMTKISSVSSLKPGDVLCFDTNEDGTCDHVGMFLSGNTYIEASQGAGVVRTNKLDSYYKRVFMWARRMA